MSIALYRLGRFIARRRGLVLGIWGLLFAFLLGCSALLGDHYDDSFSIPGTESQQGQDLVGERFGQTGATRADPVHSRRRARSPTRRARVRGRRSSTPSDKVHGV